MIDPDALRRIRTDRGLSQRQLAAAVGVDPLTVKRLEDGADSGDLPLRVVERLAATLGVDVRDLLHQYAQGLPTSETLTRTIGATLLANGRTTKTNLAAGAHATPDDVTAAVEALNTHLGAVGMAVARHHDELWLVPRVDPITASQANRPLSIGEARLLRRIHRGEDVRRILSKVDRQFTLPALHRRCLVDDTGSGPTLSASAAASLNGGVRSGNPSA